MKELPKYTARALWGGSKLTATVRRRGRGFFFQHFWDPHNTIYPGKEGELGSKLSLEILLHVCSCMDKRGNTWDHIHCIWLASLHREMRQSKARCCQILGRIWESLCIFIHSDNYKHRSKKEMQSLLPASFVFIEKTHGSSPSHWCSIWKCLNSTQSQQVWKTATSHAAHAATKKTRESCSIRHIHQNLNKTCCWHGQAVPKEQNFVLRYIMHKDSRGKIRLT